MQQRCDLDTRANCLLCANVSCAAFFFWLLLQLVAGADCAGSDVRAHFRTFYAFLSIFKAISNGFTSPSMYLYLLPRFTTSFSSFTPPLSPRREPRMKPSLVARKRQIYPHPTSLVPQVGDGQPSRSPLRHCENDNHTTGIRGPFSCRCPKTTIWRQNKNDLRPENRTGWQYA